MNLDNLSEEKLAANHRRQTAPSNEKLDSGSEEVYGQARYLKLCEQDVSAGD